MPNAWIIKLKQCAKEYQSTKPTKSKTTKNVTPKKEVKIFSSVGTLPIGAKTDEFPLFKMVWEQLGYQVKRKR